MFGSIIRKDKAFYEMFEKSAVNLCQGTQSLVNMLKGLTSTFEEKSSEIKEIEHKGDQLTHQTIELLNKTFITPIDREDIYELITKLDDILDLMDDAANRLVLYKIQYVPVEAIAFGEILVKASDLLLHGIRSLRNMKQSKNITSIFIKVYSLENEGDYLLRRAMVNLFDNKKDDAIYIIKWKEIYEDLEGAIDCCEDVANIIEGIVLKHA